VTWPVLANAITIPEKMSSVSWV